MQARESNAAPAVAPSPAAVNREFNVNDRKANAPLRFPKNEVKTSRYTLISFLPMNLFEQFRRLANFYFLITVLLQIIPNVSPFPIYTIAMPLAFILAVTMIKQAYEDIVSISNICKLT
jgi:phospholipid-translocating ATPase